MAREIKFRAWDKKLKRMFYDGDKYYPEHFDRELRAVTGSVIVTHLGLYFWVHEAQLPDATDRHFDHSSIRKIDSQVTMEFMGKSDKNGKEIFESDVVRCHQFTQELGENLGVCEGEKETVCVVTYIQENTCFGFVEINPKDEDRGYIEPCLCSDEGIEIIGNIWENPEVK